MRRLRTVILMGAVLVLAASCGGAARFAPAPTPDPLTGQYIVNGGGGALDNVKALTEAFGKQHPALTWQGLEDGGSDAGVNLTAHGDADLGYISRDLRDAEKGNVMSVAIRASGTAVAVGACTPAEILTRD